MTARTAPDPYVFGPHRGGVFLHPGYDAVPTDPQWYAQCLRHRVERVGDRCPACAGEGER